MLTPAFMRSQISHSSVFDPLFPLSQSGKARLLLPLLTAHFAHQLQRSLILRLPSGLFVVAPLFEFATLKHCQVEDRALFISFPFQNLPYTH